MTVGTSLNIAKLLTDGVATEFDFSFRVFEQTHLEVFLRELDGTVVKTYAQNEFSVFGLGGNSGTVTIVPAPADGHELIIRRVVPLTQDTDIVNQGGFFPEVIERQLDLIVMQAQQLREELNRAIVSSIGDPAYAFGRITEGEVVQLVDGTLQGLTVDEFSERAETAALVAQALSGDLYDSVAEYYADSPVNGEGFAVDNGDGTANVYVNGAGIEVLVRVIIIDPSANGSAALIGTSSGESVQEVLDALGGGDGVDLTSGVTGVLPLANGGVGADNAADARSELEAAASGANEDITSLRQSTTVAESGTIAANSIGFRGLPLSAQSQGALITLALTDNGKLVMNTTGGWAVPANASIPFPRGTVIVLYNDSGSTQTVAITSDTMRWAGTANVGTRTVAIRGYALLTKIKDTEWTIEGNLT